METQKNGRPPVPVEWLKKEWRSRGLLKRVQLTISGCLGPCDLPNVVTISNENGTQWFGEITEFEQYRDLVDWAARSRDAGALLPLPNMSQIGTAERLTERSRSPDTFQEQTGSHRD